MRCGVGEVESLNYERVANAHERSYDAIKSSQDAGHPVKAGVFGKDTGPGDRDLEDSLVEFMESLPKESRQSGNRNGGIVSGIKHAKTAKIFFSFLLKFKNDPKREANDSGSK